MPCDGWLRGLLEAVSNVGEDPATSPSTSDSAPTLPSGELAFRVRFRDELPRMAPAVAVRLVEECKLGDDDCPIPGVPSGTGSEDSGSTIPPSSSSLPPPPSLSTSSSPPPPGLEDSCAAVFVGLPVPVLLACFAAAPAVLFRVFRASGEDVVGSKPPSASITARCSRALCVVVSSRFCLIRCLRPLPGASRGLSATTSSPLCIGSEVGDDRRSAAALVPLGFLVGGLVAGGNSISSSTSSPARAEPSS